MPNLVNFRAQLQELWLRLRTRIRGVTIVARYNRDRFRKKLRQLLAQANDESFCELIWSIDAVQSDRAEFAKRHLRFPTHAATTSLDSRFAIFKWDLETLTNYFLLVTKSGPTDSRTLNCREFGTAATLVNLLRGLEDAESAIYLKRFSVLNELPRIGYRQFPWQRGYFNAPQLYRSYFIYGQGECARYFKEQYGLTINDFSLIGFFLFTAFQKQPLVKKNLSLAALGVVRSTLRAGLSLLSIADSEARLKARSLIDEVGAKSRDPLPTAFHPSLLRRFPIISFGSLHERLRCPLPQLLLLRITSGLYYDLVSGPAHLRNEASGRFEQYAAKYISAQMPSFNVQGSEPYWYRGNQAKTPDICVRFCGEVVAAFECKASKLTFAAQYSEDPISEAERSYSELAKGVHQLWRYFSHARRGLIPTQQVSPQAIGIVLTLDAWLVISTDLHDAIVKKAQSLTEVDPNIIPQDRRRVIFCSIEELENILSQTDETEFLHTLSLASQDDRYLFWTLPNIRLRTGNADSKIKPFPFDLATILPWQERLRALRPDP